MPCLHRAALSMVAVRACTFLRTPRRPALRSRRQCDHCVSAVHSLRLLRLSVRIDPRRKGRLQSGRLLYVKKIAVTLELGIESPATRH